MKLINKPIEMICIVDRKGVIHPKKFKVEGKDGIDYTVNVLKVSKFDEKRISGIKTRIYICEVKINDLVRICELRFGIENTLWCVHKM